VACDFDGTLAPVVADPTQARPAPGAIEALVALHRQGARVVVVSGRPLSFLARHLPDDIDVAGLYGLQSRLGGVVAVHPDALAWQAIVATAVERCRSELAGSGARVEDKDLSLTLHWREHPEVEPAVRSVAEAVATATGLVLQPAKASVELHPPVTMDKGRAVLELLSGCDPVVMLGDDVGDLSAFAALGELAGAGAEVTRVAVRSAESPPELLAAADVIVDGPSAAVEWLDALLSSPR
jgi:trehalose 6-phosphate phosphatase